MKRSRSVIMLALALSLALMSGCLGPGSAIEEKIFLRSYVMGYYDAEKMELKEQSNSEAYDTGILILFTPSSSLGRYDSTGELKESYDALCEKHNDMTFKQTITLRRDMGEHGTSNLGVDFTSIDVVSDADFDDEHPAGESLGDIVTFSSISLKPYIESGYKVKDNGSEYHSVEGLVSELTAEQLILLGEDDYAGNLYFEREPTLEKSHTFTVTMTPEGDREPFTASIEWTFE